MRANRGSQRPDSTRCRQACRTPGVPRIEGLGALLGPGHVESGIDRQVPAPMCLYRHVSSITPESRALRDAFARFPTGVTIVTALDPEARAVGITISSFNTVSLQPPLALWSLSQQSSHRSAFYPGSAHVIQVLAEDQEALARQFASRVEDRFQGVATQQGSSRVPMLSGCAAYFECLTEACHPAGDHVIILSRIHRHRHEGRPPLVFHGSAFTRLMPSA